MPVVPSGPGLWANLTKQTASEELARAVKQLEDFYHMTFLGSAILLAWTDKIMQKERKH